MPSSFPPSLPPRRQSFRRHVRRGAVRESTSILLPTAAGPEPGCSTELYTRLKKVQTVCRRSRRNEIFARQTEKKRKAQLSRAINRCAVRFAGGSLRIFGKTRSAIGVHRLLSSAKKPVHVPPSLGAQYQGLWKTCQEKFILQPQNLPLRLSKASIPSGRCAGCNSNRFRRKLHLIVTMSAVNSKFTRILAVALLAASLSAATRAPRSLATRFFRTQSRTEVVRAGFAESRRSHAESLSRCSTFARGLKRPRENGRRHRDQFKRRSRE